MAIQDKFVCAYTYLWKCVDKYVNMYVLIRISVEIHLIRTS